MQLEQLLDGIEDPADHIGLGIPRQLLHVTVGHQIEVEFGTHPLDDMGEPERGRIGLVIEAGGRRHGAQHRRIVTRAKGKALVDDDGRDVGVQHHRAEGVFEASDDDRLIDERHRPGAAACAIRR